MRCRGTHPDCSKSRKWEEKMAIQRIVELFSTWCYLERSLLALLSNNRQTARKLFILFTVFSSGSWPKKNCPFWKAATFWFDLYQCFLCFVFEWRLLGISFVPFRSCLNLALMQRAKTVTDHKWLIKHWTLLCVAVKNLYFPHLLYTREGAFEIKWGLFGCFNWSMPLQLWGPG